MFEILISLKVLIILIITRTLIVPYNFTKLRTSHLRAKIYILEEKRL